MDAVSISSTFSSSNFGRARGGCGARLIINAGLGCAVFRLEPLAVAAGIEALLRDGSIARNYALKGANIAKLSSSLLIYKFI